MCFFKVGEGVGNNRFSQETLADPLHFLNTDLLGRIVWMCAFGEVLKGCLFLWEKKFLSAKGKETISVNKEMATACNVTHEIIVARASKCNHCKGSGLNQACDKGPPR